MAIRSPKGGPIRRWHFRSQDIATNTKFIDECLWLWDQGIDTKEISLILFQPEAIVWTATRLGRERRRAKGAKGNAESGFKDKEEDPQRT